MDIKKELLELFDDSLLDGARPFAKAITADDRIMQKIAEIKEWIAQNGREPQKDGNLKEKIMFASLTTLKEKLLCLQTESYHRALSKHSERFRSADGDEPLRYASRTLVILRTMKGLRLARAGR